MLSDDIQRFELICSELGDRSSADKIGGIGTYAEGPMHIALKRFIDPNSEHYEIPVGRYIADIKNGERIYEIQTAQFARLKDRLSCFLQEHQVTVVFPLPVKRSLVWVDPESGECSSPNPARRLPKPVQLLAELAPIAEFVQSEGFSVMLVQLECVDHRLLIGWSKDKKRGSKRFSRTPIAMQDLSIFQSAEDYRRLLPNIQAPFTASELSKLTKMKSRDTYAMIKTMLTLGLARECGYVGRAKSYILND